MLAQREEWRRILAEFFNELQVLGENAVGVRFLDECPNCGGRMEVGTLANEVFGFCHNHDCLSNEPEVTP